MDMSSSFYTRFRGQVQGPFTWTQLRNLAERGRLSRQHEISEDAVVWSRAADYPDLFAARVQKKVRVAPTEIIVAQPAVVAATPTASPSQEAPAAATEATWHYMKDGAKVGPIAQSELLMLHARGELSNDTLIWTKGIPEWVTWAKSPFATDVPAEAQPAPAKTTPHSLQEEAFPINANSLARLFQDETFWGIALAVASPLLISTLEGEAQKYIIPALFGYFGIIWGFVFKSMVVRHPAHWGVCLGAMAFTAFVGIPMLLAVQEHVFSEKFRQLPMSPDLKLSLVGFLLNVGPFEELIKAIPVIVYLGVKGRSANPLTAVLIGVFSGLGFAANEANLYANPNFAEARTAEEKLASLVKSLFSTHQTMLRVTSLAFLHATWSGIFAYFLAAGTVGHRARAGLVLVGFLIASQLHGIYDWLQSVQRTAAALITVVTLVLFYTYLGRLRQARAEAAT